VPEKRKIINDPVSGFIQIQGKGFLSLIDHPYFQRLRRIRQLGMTDLVYPGAVHSRFQHTLGTFHLMQEALRILIEKGIDITEKECRACLFAILLHDIGHGPFSHALETSIVHKVNHEDISLVFMNYFAAFIHPDIHCAIEIFRNQYPKKFLHQLISGQLDLDRLDYLKRDSFYTGVMEGTIGAGRIIRMLHVKDNTLVLEEKAIHSIENFLLSRRSMYWQVYLHKTVVSAEQLLIRILKRAKFLCKNKTDIFASPALKYFLEHDVNLEDFSDNHILDSFAGLDDSDIALAVKIWAKHKDKILSLLSNNLLGRDLFRVELSKKAFDQQKIVNLKNQFCSQTGFDLDESDYFVFTGKLESSLYNADNEEIKFLMKDQSIKNINQLKGDMDFSAMKTPVKRHFLCYPKSLKISL
jgi:uncharacterized protein